MEHKKISAVIFDMDGVIVDSEFVYMDYLLEFARKKNPEVTMDQLNPMVGLSRKDSWTVMKNAVDNGQTWEELRDDLRSWIFTARWTIKRSSGPRPTRRPWN